MVETTDNVTIPAADVELEGDLVIPEHAIGIVLFAHGSGSSRFSSRNRFVASQLRKAKLATLLMDLLTRREEEIEQFTGHLRFDIGLLADRLVAAAQFLSLDPRTINLPLGLFGASTGGGAALVAAARRPELVQTVVSRGGRPDLAHEALPQVKCPVLLIVGGRDEPVIEMNREAMAQMSPQTEVKLEIVPAATHLFEEPGTLEKVAELAQKWFVDHLHAGPVKLFTDGLYSEEDARGADDRRT